MLLTNICCHSTDMEVFPMALINTVPPEEAEGIIGKGYDMFLERLGTIPKPMEMFSVSPKLFELRLKRMNYLAKHPKLSFALLAHIRYLVSHNLNFKFCTDFNKHIIQKLGVTEENFQQMTRDPKQSLLEDHESAMLDFVVRAVKNPSSVDENEVNSLKEMGWEDIDLVDALSQGVSMQGAAIMMQAFQMDQNCLIR